MSVDKASLLAADLTVPQAWSLASWVAGCQGPNQAAAPIPGFGATPRPTWISQQFGAGPEQWRDATNIVFSKYEPHAQRSHAP